MRVANGGSFDLYNAIIQGRRGIDDLNLLCIVCNALDRAVRKAPDVAQRYRIVWRYAMDPVERHERSVKSWATRRSLYGPAGVRP